MPGFGQEYRTANTTQLLDICRETERRELNRAVIPEEIEKVIDPDGVHLVQAWMPHPIRAMRCMVFMKVIDSMEPVEFFLDVFEEQYDALPSAARIQQALLSIDTAKSLQSVIVDLQGMET